MDCQVISMKDSFLKNEINYIYGKYCRASNTWNYFLILYRFGLVHYEILCTRFTYVKLIQVYKHGSYLHSRIDMWFCYEINVYVRKTSSIIYAWCAPVQILLIYFYAFWIFQYSTEFHTLQIKSFYSSHQIHYLPDFLSNL